MRSNLPLARNYLPQQETQTLFSEKDFNICVFQQPGNPEKVDRGALH